MALSSLLGSALPAHLAPPPLLLCHLLRPAHQLAHVVPQVLQVLLHSTQCPFADFSRPDSLVSGDDGGVLALLLRLLVLNLVVNELLAFRQIVIVVHPRCCCLLHCSEDL